MQRPAQSTDSVVTAMDLSALNTLQLPSRAAYFVRCEQRRVLAQLRQHSKWGAMPWHVLGGGSNLVLPDYVDGLVIHVALKGKALLREDDDAWYVSAQAGENWHDFVLWTLAHGYAGLENLALIPGTVGAAPVQNIGAYGVEIKDYLDHLYAYDLQTGALQCFRNAQCQFAYRDSVFKTRYYGRFLITEVVFRLPKTPTLHTAYGDIAAELKQRQLPLTPVAIAEVVMAIRTRKLANPAKIGNVGSFFKNPLVALAQLQQLLHTYPTLPHYPHSAATAKLAAGWLIEQAGWKGRRLGPVGMYDQQALVLVNHGGATNADVKALCAAVQSAVDAQFGVTLEPEPVFW